MSAQAGDSYATIETYYAWPEREKRTRVSMVHIQRVSARFVWWKCGVGPDRRTSRSKLPCPASPEQVEATRAEERLRSAYSQVLEDARDALAGHDYGALKVMHEAYVAFTDVQVTP